MNLKYFLIISFFVHAFGGLALYFYHNPIVFAPRPVGNFEESKEDLRNQESLRTLEAGNSDFIKEKSKSKSKNRSESFRRADKMDSIKRSVKERTLPKKDSSAPTLKSKKPFAGDIDSAHLQDIKRGGNESSDKRAELEPQEEKVPSVSPGMSGVSPVLESKGLSIETEDSPIELNLQEIRDEGPDKKTELEPQEEEVPSVSPGESGVSPVLESKGLSIETEDSPIALDLKEIEENKVLSSGEGTKTSPSAELLDTDTQLEQDFEQIETSSQEELKEASENSGETEPFKEVQKSLDEPLKVAKAEQTVSTVKTKPVPSFSKNTVKKIQDLKQKMGNTPLHYPDFARREGLEGDVSVLFFVNQQGLVEQIQLESSSGHSELDNFVLRVLSRYEFLHGQESWVRYKIPFALKGEEEERLKLRQE